MNTERFTFTGCGGAMLSAAVWTPDSQPKIRKYADRAQPVELSIAAKNHLLVIRQKNAKCSETEPQESYRLGLNSIRRIAHNYAGQVEIQQDDSVFSITITLSEF